MKIVCVDYRAHISKSFDAICQRLSACNSLVCLVQGKDRRSTLGFSDIVRTKWAPWGDFGNLCRLHVYAHTVTEVASLITSWGACW